MPKARQTCTECSMRRQKCDRQIPCGRCVRRGQADRCTRDWPESGYNPQVHRSYPRAATATTGSSASPGHHSPTSAISARDHDRDSPLLRSVRRLPSSVEPPSSPRQQRGVNLVVDPAAQRPDSGVDVVRSKPKASLDFYGWGQESLSDYHLRSSVELQKDLQAPINAGDSDSYLDFAGSGAAAQVSLLQSLLPDPDLARKLVDYHIDNILWYHGIFHGPTFQAEFENACAAAAAAAAASRSGSGLQIRSMDLRWAALLFAVLAGSITSAPKPVRLAWAFTEMEIPRLSRQWYKASVTCLTLGDYMCRHHIYSLEAIGVLNLSAHIVGFNSTQSTLLGAALKVAQGLGLHKLGREEDEAEEEEEADQVTTRLVDRSQLRPEQRTRIIQREVGRRVWAQLCIQDWFGVPFLEMYSIQPLHFSTAVPSNLDEHTLAILPRHRATITSMSKKLLSMARIVTELHDDFLRSNTLFTKYEYVLKYDAKMRALFADDLAPAFECDDAGGGAGGQEAWPHWIPWARRSVRTCFAHKIIMLHRPFLSRSFVEPAFAYSREVCIESSKSILREIAQAADGGGGGHVPPLLWVDQAHMIAAGITLVLDLFHRKADDARLAEHRALVDTTISMLGRFEHSLMSTRGIRLLSALLMEHARMSAKASDRRRREHEEQEEGSGSGSGASSASSTGSASDGGSPPTQKRQKFDLPRFVNSFAGTDSFTQSLRGQPERATATATATATTNNTITTTTTDLYPANPSLVANGDIDGGYNDDAGLPTLEYEKFEELFPPLAGISNHFLFENLLDFEI